MMTFKCVDCGARTHSVARPSGCPACGGAAPIAERVTYKALADVEKEFVDLALHLREELGGDLPDGAHDVLSDHVYDEATQAKKSELVSWILANAARVTQLSKYAIHGA